MRKKFLKPGYVKLDDNKFITDSNTSILGPIGPQGVPGDKGIQGPKGLTGEPGIAGPSGPIGDQGPQGHTGDVGTQGPKGLTGDIGAEGNTGPTGLIGDTGPDGPSGDSGPQGPIGIPGPIILNRGIFSMQAPLGDQVSPAPAVVVYDFTNANLSNTVDNNLLASNKSGNSDLNLTSFGSPLFNYTFVQLFSGPEASTRSTTSREVISSYNGQGTAFFTNGTFTQGAWTGANTLLNITGALTIEFVCYFYDYNTNPVYMFECVGDHASSNEAENYLYRLSTVSGDTGFAYYAETGVNGEGINATIQNSIAIQRRRISLYTFVRNTDGHVRMYINGNPISDWIIPTSTASTIIPSGGENARLKINTSIRGCTLGFRIFNYVLSPIQIWESFRHTFYNPNMQA
jgi:hypothetical protein